MSCIIKSSDTSYFIVPLNKYKVSKVLLNCGLIDFNLKDFISVPTLVTNLKSYPLDTIDFYINNKNKTIDVASIKRVVISEIDMEVEDSYGTVCLCRC